VLLPKQLLKGLHGTEGWLAECSVTLHLGGNSPIPEVAI